MMGRLPGAAVAAGGGGGAMTYMDFRPLLPGSNDGERSQRPVEPGGGERRQPPSPRASWIGGGIAGVVVGLLYALAYVSLEEPAIALLITVLVLLPAASLMGGNSRSR